MTAPVNFSDFRAKAQQRLPRFLFDYADGGSYNEQTLFQNSSALQSICLRQRVFHDVAAIDLSKHLFGEDFAMPLALAPVGLAGMYARRGEAQAIQAAETMGIPFCLSTVSVCPLDEVAAAAQRPFWFQLYMIRDRAFMRDLLQNAGRLGCSALVFTVDMPVPGTRYRDYRTGLAGAPGWAGYIKRGIQAFKRPGWAWDVGLRGRPHHLGNVAPVLKGRTGLEDFLGWMRENFDPGVTWRDLDFVRENWNGPIIIKGILDVEDAKQAVAFGADGIIVSNHGGRQLDGAMATAHALPAISAAVGKDIKILVDGGIRSGLDVLKMLALGADSVLIGRPWIYALACGGKTEVVRMLRLMEAELRVAMALTGCTRINQIDASIILRG